MKAPKTNPKEKDPPIKTESPQVIASDDVREKKWRAESDYRTATAYKEIEADKSRMREMKKHARSQVQMAKSVCNE